MVTNQKLSSHSLTQLGRQVHSSLARAIQPFHTAWDGDTLYAVTTSAVDNPSLNELALGVLAAETAWDAVLSIVDTSAAGGVFVDRGAQVKAAGETE